MPRVRSLRSQAISPKRDLSPRPSSPTFSETTNASVLNFGPDGPEKIITRANLRVSIQAYEDLLSKCAAYRASLVAMSRATAGFGDAIEACAGLKGPTYESGTRLQAASGLHLLMSNHYHILADTLDKQFEKPLRQHLENYRTVVADRSNSYERALHEKSSIIRQTEMGNMKKKNRNLQTFREALSVLQRQVDELDELKAHHYQEIVEHEEEVWDVVQGKVCLVVRFTLDVFDRFTSKASDPIIEPMLQSVPDPFDVYGPPPSKDQIFSILPPLSVIANAPSSSPSPLTSSTPELEGSDGVASGKNSWAPNPGGFFPDTSAAWADVASPPVSPPPGPASMSISPARSVSPSTVEVSVGVSPPSTITRRHSHPAPSTSSIHHPRKSESKLRSVLSVIDEGQPRSNGNAEERPVRTASESSALGTALPTPKAPGSPPSHSGWSMFGFSDSYNHDRGGGDNDTTPRNSTLIRAQSPSESPSITPEDTPQAERSRSPNSDVTVVPVTT
ncbi:Protein IVY1 [Sparassis crispa]|uniref:Protein IVY1 n=1 Tax=Sparassis crispa TaxID=139825 RepID=A0A401GAQ4_9APHY|nr:Protein IVY1 [Sparassis crispa]GBE79248.1 Protein IVY1 [Sparassis crispa]